MQIFNLFFILNSKCQRHSHYSIQFDFWISSYCRHSTKMSLKFTFTVICILFIQIQAKIARDVVEEKQKLSKEEREARKKKLHCIKHLLNLTLILILKYKYSQYIDSFRSIWNIHCLEFSKQVRHKQNMNKKITTIRRMKM